MSDNTWKELDAIRESGNGTTVAFPYEALYAYVADLRAKLAAAEKERDDHALQIRAQLHDARARADAAESEVSRLGAELHIYHTALPEDVTAETHRDAKEALARGPYPVDPVDWEGEAKRLRAIGARLLAARINSIEYGRIRVELRAALARPGGGEK